MRQRLVVTLALAISLAAGAAPADAADARQRKAPPRARPSAAIQTFSGVCAGPIAGEMRVSGTVYRVSPDVRIYEIGRGAVPAGTSYYDRVVTVSGTKVRDTFIVQSVVVRPVAWSSSPGPVGVEPEASPR